MAAIDNSGLLPIIPYNVNGFRTNILLDGCSTSSYIVSRIEPQLKAQRVGYATTTINTIAGATKKKTPIVKFIITTTDGEEVEVTARVIPGILPPIAPQEYQDAIEACKRRHPELKLPEYNGDIKVDILLSGQVTNALTGEQVWKMGKHLEIRDTKLGQHFLQGKLDSEEYETITMLTTNLTNGDSNSIMMLDDRKLEEAVEESLNRREFSTTEDDDASKEEIIRRFEETIGKECDDQGKFMGYIVSLPWKSPEARENIPENKKQSLAVLNSNCRKMEKIGRLQQLHQSILGHMEDGILREVNMSDPEDAARRSFLPSFGVVNAKSSTSPVRLVAAANCPRGRSVNDALEPSVNLLRSLDALVHRWRIYETGVVGDVAKAYYRISIHPEDRRAFNILWYKKPETREGLMVLEITKVPMGSGPGQAVLLLVFGYHLKNDVDQEASLHLLESLYSDNVVTSLQRPDLEDFCLRMVKSFERGGFQLRKFSTNNPALRDKLRAEGLYNEAEKEMTHVLGLRWLIGPDLCGFQTPTGIEPGTNWSKRRVLSFCHQAYDAGTGILCGISIRATAFFSEICTTYDWDDRLTEEDLQRWKPIHSDLIRATQVTFDRWYGIPVDKPCRLHLFSDASSCKYLACLAYLEADGKSVLVAGKARLPPKGLREKENTVPKLELEALVMTARLLEKLWGALSPHYKQLTALIHSDATIPLSWLINRSTQTRFVANRTKRFWELVDGRATLHFVETANNVADFPSRGMRIEDYCNPDHDFWHGPKLIHDYTLEPFQAGQVSMAGEMVLATTTEGPEDLPPSVLNLVDCTRSLYQITRSLAVVIRSVRKWRKQPELGERQLAKLAARKLLLAEQAQSMPEIIQYLQGGRGPRHAWIQPMSLWLDRQGLVRLGGRLGRSNLDFASKFPILYPKTSPLYRQRILEYHRRSHCGTVGVKQQLQRQFWTPAIGKSIQHIIRDCYQCKRASGRPLRAPGPPPLPPERVIPIPYAAVGTDYTGFFTVRDGKETKKVYLLLISCAATRHFATYVVDNLTTETFLHVLRRHGSVFGSPLVVFSDRAATYLSAREVLGQALADTWVSEVGESLGKRGISWRPNPSSLSPEMSGHIEALVKLVKACLKRAIGRQLVGIEEFRTLVAEATCSCNERPLASDVSPDHRDRAMVTPNKLLFGHPISSLPYGEGNLEELDDPSYIPEERELGRTWKKLAKKLETFRRHFAEDWLMSLRQRHIDDHVADPVVAADVGVGDLVIIRKENVKRALWDLATVERIIPSTDGKVRALELRTEHGCVTRPLGKVFPLVKSRQLHGEVQPPAPAETAVAQPTVQPNDDALTTHALPRPTRTAKEAGRQRVRRWTQSLQESADEDE